MNKYRVGLSVLVGLFVIIAIFSSMIGVGLLQGFLILMAFILLLTIFVGGIAGLGAKDFWWEYFKPFAAMPIAWGLLHLGFAFMFPETSSEIWAFHWKLLMVVELFIFVLSAITNKKTPFEKRTSRKLLEATYILFFIAAGIMIGWRLFWGESAANLNREILYELMNSKVELTVENIEKLDKGHRVKPFLVELNRLSKKSEKSPLSKTELQKAERLKATVKKIYAVPESKKLKLWLFGKSAEARVKRPRPKRHFSGVFKLPADGTVVDKDKDGQGLWYRKGEYVRFQQLGSPGKFTIVNKKAVHPSWTTSRRVVSSGQSKYSDKIQLMAADGKNITVQVRIIPGRS